MQSLVVHPIPHKAPANRNESWVPIAIGVATSAALHLGISLVIDAPEKRVAPNESTRVSLVTPKPKPKSTPAPVEPVKAPEPDSPAVAKAPTPKPKPQAPRKVRQPKAPAPEPSTPEPVPEIVGLDFSSTVSGGGPAFATGNTRFGETAGQATGSQETRAPAIGKKGRETPTPQASPNRKATRIPGGIKITRPKRLRKTEPPYPPGYRAQGLEADVTVEVRLDKRGKVKSARIVGSSRHQAFNTVALQSAKRESYSPARRGEQAVPFSLTFTYRFRING